MKAKDFYKKYGFDSCIFDITNDNSYITAMNNLDYNNKKLRKMKEDMILLKAKIKFYEEQLKEKDKNEK